MSVIGRTGHQHHAAVGQGAIDGCVLVECLREVHANQDTGLFQSVHRRKRDFRLFPEGKAIDGMIAPGKLGRMHQKHRELTISTTNFNAEPLGELLNVYEALRSGDEARLLKLWESTKSAEDFSEMLRVAVAHDNYPIVSRGVIRAHEHAALWMMPVVVRPGHGDGLAVDMWMQRWLQEQVSSQMQKVATLEIIPSIETILSLQPTQLQGLLAMLLRRETPTPVVELKSATSASERQDQIPMLRFIVGSVSRINEEPEFPAIDGLELQKFARRASLQTSAEGKRDAVIPDTIRAGEMLPFRDAVVAGLLLWIDEISRAHEVVAWSLEPRMSVVNLSLEIALEDGAHALLGAPLPLWEVGREGIEVVTQRCSEWKFCQELLSSFPIPAKLS